MGAATVMIVEDEWVIAKDLQMQLEELGYVVSSSVPTGEEAIALTLEDKPNLILMDIKLTGTMDGIQAARIIRRETPIPVIFLTSISISELMAQAQSLEPLSYLIKPVKPQDLQLAVVMAFFRAAMGNTLQ
jgi:two-component system, response regulator PdtaR